LILSNLDLLYQKGAAILLRCPLVPGVNDSPEHLKGIADLSAWYPGLAGVEIMAYHDLGREKGERVGLERPLKGLGPADEETKARWLETLKGLGCRGIRLG